LKNSYRGEILSSSIREIQLFRFKRLNIQRLRKYFAQCDVDLIHNFPISGSKISEDSGFGINVFPYYSLAYYSNGKNRLLGLVKKIKTNDKEILTKLRTL
jgi:hypothetical protein